MDSLRYGGTGWKRDLPDFRDYTPQTDVVKEVLTGALEATQSGDAPPAGLC